MSKAVVAISSVVDDEVRTATVDVLNDEAQVVFLQDQSGWRGPGRCAMRPS